MPIILHTIDGRIWEDAKLLAKNSGLNLSEYVMMCLVAHNPWVGPTSKDFAIGSLWEENKEK